MKSLKLKTQNSKLKTQNFLLDFRGFTLFEIFLALFILAIAIIPMTTAFTPALTSSGFGEEQAVLSGQVRSTMNRLSRLDFRTLNANQADPVNLTTLFGSSAEAQKENLTYKGQTYVPIVAIADASNNTGGLLDMTVTLGAVSLKTSKTER